MNAIKDAPPHFSQTFRLSRVVQYIFIVRQHAESKARSHRLARFDRCSGRTSAHRTTELTVERSPKNQLIFRAAQRRLSNTPPFHATQVNLAPLAAQSLIPTFGKTVTERRRSLHRLGSSRQLQSMPTFIILVVFGIYRPYLLTYSMEQSPS